MFYELRIYTQNVLKMWEAMNRQKIKYLQNIFKAKYLWAALTALLRKEMKDIYLWEAEC